MSTPININEIGWYLLSVSSNKTIHEAKQEWGILADTIDDIIYELKTPPIENGVQLTRDNWTPINTTNDDVILYPNIGYWVYISELNTQPEPEPEPEPEPMPEPEPEPEPEPIPEPEPEPEPMPEPEPEPIDPYAGLDPKMLLSECTYDNTTGLVTITYINNGTDTLYNQLGSSRFNFPILEVQQNELPDGTSLNNTNSDTGIPINTPLYYQRGVINYNGITLNKVYPSNASPVICPQIHSYTVYDADGNNVTNSTYVSPTTNSGSDGNSFTNNGPDDNNSAIYEATYSSVSIYDGGTQSGLNYISITNALNGVYGIPPGYKITMQISAYYTDSDNNIKTTCGFQPGKTYAISVDDITTFWYSPAVYGGILYPGYYGTVYWEADGKNDESVTSNNTYMFTYYSPSETTYAVDIGDDNGPNGWPFLNTQSYYPTPNTSS
jgi:hypothetical protein